MHHIRVDVTTSAQPADVYALLRDGASWPACTPLGSFELERPGDREREGVGAIRVFRTGRIRSREQIVELVPTRRFSYTLLSGLALRDYRADIELESVAAGTVIHWHSSFKAKVPGTGWIYRRQLARFIGQVARGLAVRATADRRATPNQRAEAALT
jgi:hypothetical protein